MVFSTSDVYTTSGDVKLWNNWTQDVSKYDASSFYNWEQDNLPLYDIEERTYSNWEQHGFPTSCVPGLALVVSADAPAASLACNQNLFTSVSGAIEALPQHIRFPVLIEVANFKDLEDLKLHNIKMGYRGSLEIINRNFSKVYSTSATKLTHHNTAGTHGLGLVTAYRSTDVSATLAGNQAVAINTAVFSGVHDSRFTEVNTVIGVPGKSNSAATLSCKLSVGIKGANALTGVANSFAVDNYDLLTTDTTFHTYDISSTNQITGTEILRDKPTGAPDIVGMVYGNAFDQISVKNCDGPIYIRGFFADGAGVRDNPILIENSNVFLENCAAVRGLEAGVKFVNSNSVISRGLVSYRNYGLSGFAARVSPSYGAGVKLVNSEVEIKHERLPADNHNRVNTAFDASAYPEDLLLNFSRNDYGIVLENSTLKGGTNSSIAPGSNPSFLQCEHNTMAGVLLKNSTLDVDGLLDVYNNNYGIKSLGSTLKTNQISVEGNTRIGYHGLNSTFIYNKDAVNINNHSVTRSGWASRSQTEFLWNGQNIRLEGGSILEPVYVGGMPTKYGEFLCASSHGNVDSPTPNAAVDLKGQSPNIEILGGSVGRFVGLKGLRDDVYSNNDPGTDLTSYGDIVLVDGGSAAMFHGTAAHATVICGPQSAYRQYNKAAICAKNNSTVKFSGPTIIGQYGVNVLATDNSVATFGPPFRDDGSELKDYFDLGTDSKNHTNIELHATRACLVAENNSTINLEDMGDFSGVWANSPSFGAGAAGGYNYGSFSPMASSCSAGSFQFYPNPADNNLGGATTASGTDDLASNSLSMTAKAFLSDTAAIVPTAATNNGVKYNHILGDPMAGAFDNEAYSLGGMCVRVLNGSMINVRNVHFLTGYSHAPSGVIYDVSAGVDPGDAGKCDRLFIWNVDDSSELKAELVSVSSLNPGEETIMMNAGYHGPQAYWTSADSVGSPTPQAAFACPSSTPDTGAFSILDQYGKGNEAHLWIKDLSTVSPYKTILNEVSGANVVSGFVDYALSSARFNYGYATPKNLGPFRLYFGVDPAVNQLQVATSGYYQASSHAVFGHNALATGHVGPPIQLMSQGYSLSGDASALSVSGDPWWDSLKQFTGERGPETSSYVPTGWAASGYYYTDDFVAPAFTRVFLDESASNMFANAKNASTGTSRRPKLVTIFDSRIVPQGDGTSVSGINDGVGIHSLNNFDLNKRN